MKTNMKTILLSYPRCGNTFLRFAIEMHTGKATVGYPHQTHKIAKPLVNKEKDVIAIKRHHNAANENPDKLILIVRNYKENLIRHTGKLNVKEVTPYLENKGVGEQFITNIKYFDSFSGPKLLVRYEDLIDDSVAEKVIKEVVEFLGHEYNDAIKLKDIRDAGLGFYEASETKGKDKVHHSKKLTDKQHKEWEEYFKENYSEYYDKYLYIRDDKDGKDGKMDILKFLIKYSDEGGSYTNKGVVYRGMTLTELNVELDRLRIKNDKRFKR